MDYLHLPFREAIKLLADRLGLSMPILIHNERQSLSHLSTFLNQVALYFKKKLKKEGKIAIDYLKKRQVSGEIAALYQIGYALPGWNHLANEFKNNIPELKETGMVITKDNGQIYDRYRERIMFPIHDRQGRVIGFGGRSLEATQKPKYLNSPETSLFQKSKELYGLYQLLSRNQQTIPYIIIVEGYLDVIALANMDFMIRLQH